MSAPDDEERSHEPAAKRFMTTRWSVLLAVRDGDDAQAREALSSLCETYWYPLYAYIRRQGHDDESARDLVQGFLTRLLERKDLAAVDQRRGRFRSYLMAACSNYLANQADHDRAIKRGGGRSPISIDRLNAEGRYNAEPSHALTAGRLFERQWAITLLDRVLARLDAEMERAGKRDQLAVLRPALLGEAERAPYARVASDLNITEEAARAAVYRLRRRYRELLREEVARTLDEEADVDAEIRELFLALGG